MSKRINTNTNKKKFLRNSRGQGLVEYLIIVALVGVATISVVKVVGQNLTARFANISNALHGNDKKVNLEDVNSSDLHSKSLDTFMRGVGAN